MRRALRAVLPPLVAAGLVVLAWQLLAMHEPPSTVASVPTTLRALGSAPGLYWHDTLTTLEELAVGAAASFAVAFALAAAMVHVEIVERAVMPLAVALNVTPVIAYAPLLTIFFGFSLTPRFLVTGIITFFPFLVNSLVGLRSVEPGALEVLATLDASRWEVLTRLRMPSSLPFLLAAARICLPLAVVGAVVAEYTAPGSAGGLGSLIASANQSLAVGQLYAAILVLVALGVVLTVVVVVLERRLVSWHSSARRD